MQNALTAKLHTDTEDTLNWLLRSIAIQDGHGSSAYFSRFRHPWKGWAAAYPETTGYIIETLLNYHEFRSDQKLLTAASSCADWLLSIQMDNGAFTSLFVSTNKPSVFNTGQILFGLRAIFLQTSSEKYLNSLKKALQWLENQINSSGEWEGGSYIDGFIPSYYTRVIWAMLLSYELLTISPPKKVIVALALFKKKVQTNHSVINWAFRPNEMAQTHTIAYTFRGFLECGLLLNDEECLTITELGMQELIKSHQKNGKLAGRYDLNWNGDYSYRCITGNAQLSIICHKLFESTSKRNYLDFAITFLGDAQEAKVSIPFPNWKGAIPGSFPWWGKYLPFKFPNWAAKFYLDAAFLFLKTE